MGIGQNQSGDDGAGNALIKKLKKNCPFAEEKGIQLIDAAEMPENYTGDIRAFSSGWVIVIDAADMRIQPGEPGIIRYGEIREEEMTTHRLPLTLVIRYIRETIGSKVMILGIQPYECNEKTGLSTQVKKALSGLQKFFTPLINNHRGNPGQ